MYFIVSDNTNSVSVFTKDHKYHDAAQEIEWCFYGKYRAHSL